MDCLTGRGGSDILFGIMTDAEIQSLAGLALSLMPKGAEELVRQLGAEKKVCPASVHKLGKNILLLTEDGELLLVADYAKVMAAGFEGREFALADGGVALAGSCSPANAAALRRHFPWCAPVLLRKKEYAVEGMPLSECTGKYFPVYYDCDGAAFEVFREDFREGVGVVSPLISSFEEMDRACASPCSLFRFRLGGGERKVSGVDNVYAAVYSGKNFVLSGNGEISFSEELARSLGESYHASFEFARKAYGVLRSRCGGAFDLGIVLPDGAGPEEHLFVIRELRKRGVDFAMLRPGCSEEHRAVARAYGGYKLAVPPEAGGSILFYSGTGERPE